ncbi:hypothetical protein ACOME3_008622 [Neoechinorhynchus agilis]
MISRQQSIVLLNICLLYSRFLSSLCSSSTHISEVLDSEVNPDSKNEKSWRKSEDVRWSRQKDTRVFYDNDMNTVEPMRRPSVLHPFDILSSNKCCRVWLKMFPDQLCLRRYCYPYFACFCGDYCSCYVLFDPLAGWMPQDTWKALTSDPWHSSGGYLMSCYCLLEK